MNFTVLVTLSLLIKRQGMVLLFISSFNYHILSICNLMVQWRVSSAQPRFLLRKVTLKGLRFPDHSPNLWILVFIGLFIVIFLPFILSILCSLGPFSLCPLKFKVKHEQWKPSSSLITLLSWDVCFLFHLHHSLGSRSTVCLLFHKVTKHDLFRGLCTCYSFNLALPSTLHVNMAKSLSFR